MDYGGHIESEGGHWASVKLGQMVVGGECWDLANNALFHAGIGTLVDFGLMGDDADYVRGTPIHDLKDYM